MDLWMMKHGVLHREEWKQEALAHTRQTHTKESQPSTSKSPTLSPLRSHSVGMPVPVP